MTSLIFVLLLAGDAQLPPNVIMDVTAEPPSPPFNMPAECKLTIHKGANPDDFYPKAVRRASETRYTTN